jgi:putative ABC transport system substrate-binding protein
VRRREFIAALGSAAAWPLMARAQQPKLLRVGAVAGSPKSAPQWVAFDQRMAELGYQEGKNFVFEFIQAATIDDYARGYRELVTRKVDVLVALGPEIALKSAVAVTDTMPIVMVAIDYDPFSRHYVTSLARPSGNVTGLIFQQVELAAKRIQLIKEAFPHIPAAIMFWDEASADQWQAAQNAAATLSLPLFGSELREPPYNYEGALAAAAPDHRRTLIVATSPFFFRDRKRLAELALQHRMVSRTQVRQARAILGWSVRDLAMRAFVSIAAVNLIEGADVLPSENSRQLAAVRATLEAAGIEFLEGNAIARRTPPFPH